MGWFYLLGVMPASDQELESVVQNLKDEVLIAWKGSSKEGELRQLANDLIKLNSVLQLHRLMRDSISSMTVPALMTTNRSYRDLAPDAAQAAVDDVEDKYKHGKSILNSMSRPLNLAWMTRVLEESDGRTLTPLDLLKRHQVEWLVLEQLMLMRTDPPTA